MTTSDVQNVGIKSSTSLLAFASRFAKMQVGLFETTDAEGQKQQFHSCIFTDAMGEHTFVGFSRKLGELTPSEIVAQKDDLQVVQLESDHYVLCRKGASAWEDVNLFQAG